MTTERLMLGGPCHGQIHVSWPDTPARLVDVRVVPKVDTRPWPPDPEDLVPEEVTYSFEKLVYVEFLPGGFPRRTTLPVLLIMGEDRDDALVEGLTAWRIVVGLIVAGRGVMGSGPDVEVEAAPWPPVEEIRLNVSPSTPACRKKSP